MKDATRQRNGWRWGVALAALLVGALGMLARKTRATTAELDQLRAEVANLKDQEPAGRTVVVREVRTEAAPQAPAGSAPVVAAPTPPLSHEEKERRAKVFHQARQQLFDETYARESTDPEWSPSAVRTVLERYGGKEFQALKISAACKKTMCRMDFTYSDSDHQGEIAAHKLVETNPWPAHRFTRIDGDDHAGFMYIAREGFDLPKLDPKTVTY
jgi:hypothetical protein